MRLLLSNRVTFLSVQKTAGSGVCLPHVYVFLALFWWCVTPCACVCVCVYRPLQCSTGGQECWCVDGDGQEVPGTRTNGSAPLCETNNCYIHSYRCHCGVINDDVTCLHLICILFQKHIFFGFCLVDYCLVKTTHNTPQYHHHHEHFHPCNMSLTFYYIIHLMVCVQVCLPVSSSLFWSVHLQDSLKRFSVTRAGGSAGVLTRLGWSYMVQDRMGDHRAVSTPTATASYYYCMKCWY